jgi:hypothetical protein
MRHGRCARARCGRVPLAAPSGAHAAEAAPPACGTVSRRRPREGAPGRTRAGATGAGGAEWAPAGPIVGPRTLRRAPPAHCRGPRASRISADGSHPPARRREGMARSRERIAADARGSAGSGGASAPEAAIRPGELRTPGTRREAGPTSARRRRKKETLQQRRRPRSAVERPDRARPGQDAAAAGRSPRFPTVHAPSQGSSISSRLAGDGGGPPSASRCGAGRRSRRPSSARLPPASGAPRGGSPASRCRGSRQEQLPASPARR